jgi:hypothetical protein
MAERIVQRTYLEIDDGLLEAVRKAAAEQGRDEREVIEEALRRYLEAPSDPLVESLRREQEQRRERRFMELLDRMSSRFDLDEDEAMNLATAEIRAMREERRQALAREREEGKPSES